MTTIDEFAGTWTYRSFLNDPKFDEEADKRVLLATAELILEIDDCGEISGKLIMYMYDGSRPYLNVSGTAEPGEPPTICFSGTGADGTPTDGWLYDYIGYLVPFWPEGIEQRPAIVGTVIRVREHKVIGGEEIRPAGYVLSFTAVARD